MTDRQFQPRSRRRAYTLLEVLLATAIGVILMGALYVAVDIQTRQTQAARERVEHSTLSRSLLARMSAEVASSLGPPDPSRFRSTSSSQAGGTAATGGAGTGTGATGGAAAGATGGTGAAGGAGATNTGTTQPTTTDTQTPVNMTNVNPRVVGDTTRLTIFVSRVPREANAANADNAPVPGDVRRITYWLAGSGGTPLGLARQEIKWATSPDVDEQPPDEPDDPSQVIAEEVKSLEFRYWDGSAWQESWDGSALGADGKTPIGPPLGIAFVIGIAPRGAGSNGGEVKLKMYRHFVAIHPANGATQATTDATGTTTTTTSP